MIMQTKMIQAANTEQDPKLNGTEAGGNPCTVRFINLQPYLHGIRDISVPL